MTELKTAKRYPKEFHRQTVEQVRAGKTKAELSREFGCSEWAISQCLKQAERDEGRGDGALTSDERHELTRLRRENLQLRMERDILSKAAAWFAQEKIPSARRSSDL